MNESNKVLGLSLRIVILEMFRGRAIGLVRRIRLSGCRTSVTTTCRGRTSINVSTIPLTTSITRFSFEYDGYEVSKWWKHQRGIVLWILIYTQAAIFLGIHDNIAFAEDVTVDSGNDKQETSSSGLRRIEDGSVISNLHTSKWRIFTDNGKKLFLQGKLEEAENYFLLALQEAKEGFGERDPHVASACNNLAELYRVRKAFDKAEPLYMEAVNILEESFGPEDIRVGAAFHNLGQFYIVQRKLEQAHIYYERALKIKGRILGHGHADYADTMYHLGTVMYLQGIKDSEVLIQESIRILEEGGLGESLTCLQRLRYLSQIFLSSNRPTEAKNVQRKILRIMELGKK